MPTDAHEQVQRAVDGVQLGGSINGLRQPRMNVVGTGPEEQSTGMNSEWFPGAVSPGSHATQTEVEKLFRGTMLYCAHGLGRGCARAVKRMKIEAAVEVASEEDSAVT